MYCVNIMNIIFFDDLKQNAVHFFITVKTCELGWLRLGERFALLWSLCVQHSIYMQLCIQIKSFVILAVLR